MSVLSVSPLVTPPARCYLFSVTLFSTIQSPPFFYYLVASESGAMTETDYSSKTLDELKEMQVRIDAEFQAMKKKLDTVKDDVEKAEAVKAIKVDMFDCREEMFALSLEIARRTQSAENKEDDEEEEKKCSTAENTESKVKRENTSNLFQGMLTDNSCSPENVRRDNGAWNADNRYGCKIKPPKFRRGDDFCTFLLRFEQYIIMSNIKDNLDCRLSTLVEDDAIFKKLRNIKFSMDERQDVKLLIEAIKRELYPPTDARIMRATFHKMRQENGEKVEQFAQRVMDEAEKIYSDRTERDGAATTALISGVLDVEVKRRLLASSVSENFISLTKLAVQEEHISEAIRMTPGSQEELESHSAIPMFGLGREHGGEQGTVNCQKCGRAGHVTESCWSDVKCQLCDRIGHVARVCRQNSRPATATQNRDSRQGRRSQVTCYNCQEVGHTQRFCNRPRGGAGARQDSYRPSNNQQRLSQRVALNGSAIGRNLDTFSRRGAQ